MSHALLSSRCVSPWLASLGVDLSRVSVQPFGASVGAGLTAATRLLPGDVALSIPKRVWWPCSAEAARLRCHERDPSAVARVDALAARLGGSETLAASTLLAADLALLRHGVPAGSTAELMGPYLETLPAGVQVPLLWPDGLRQLLLRGTSLEAACESQARPPSRHSSLSGSRSCRPSPSQSLTILHKPPRGRLGSRRCSTMRSSAAAAAAAVAPTEAAATAAAAAVAAVAAAAVATAAG